MTEKITFDWVERTPLDRAVASLPPDFLLDVGRTEIRRAMLRYQGMSTVALALKAETELSLAAATPKTRKKKAKKK